MTIRHFAIAGILSFLGAPGILNAGSSSRGRPIVFCDSLPETWEGDQTDCRFGTVAGAGDVDGDHFDDVLIGSYNYDHPEVDEGVVRLYLGSASGIAADPAWTAESNQPGAHLADKLSTAGDVNRDGYDDVILGAGDYDANGYTDGGRAFLYLGSPTGLAQTPAWFRDGNQNGGRFGANVSTAGDVNGDGYSDVIIGAWLWDNGQVDEGKAFVYLGSDSGLAQTPIWTGESNSQGAVYGYRATTAGDLNGDSFGDIVVGARRYSGDGIPREGRAYVYYGSPTGPSPTPDWTFDGEQAGAEVGSSVASAGDVDRDGFGDLLVAAFRYDNPEVDEGKVFLFLGGPDGVSTVPVWTAEGNQPDAYFGYHVTSAGDVNHDGYGDVVLGVAEWDVDGLVDAGRAHVYLGGEDGLAAVPDWTVTGDQAGAKLGDAVARAGDVNGDGCGDILLGELYRDNAYVDSGRTYLYYGCPDGSASAEPPDRAGVSLRVAGPNPFSDRLAIAYTLPAAGFIRLTLTDIAGRHVVLLEQADREPGTHFTQWDGRSRRGSPVPRGVYFLHLETAAGARDLRIVRGP